MLVKKLMTFRDFFKDYSVSQESDKVNNLKKEVWIKNPMGKLIPINGVIRKSNTSMIDVEFQDSLHHKMAETHLIKTTLGFKFAEDLNKNDDILKYKNNPIKMVSKNNYCSSSISYDISIEEPHEYITPNGLVHHNTTTSRILTDSLIKNQMDILPMNGSDSVGVDNMRTTVQGFLKSPPYESKHKIVFIDEFDYTTGNAQAVLRNIMETYADNGRFICTGNYISKIIDPIQSRFQIFEMNTIKEEFALEYCEKILKAENVNYDINTLKMIIQNFMPDVRKALNTIQKTVVNGTLKKIDINSIISNEKKIVGLLVQICDDMGSNMRDATLNKSVPAILEILSNGEPNYRGIYTSLFFNEKLPLWAKIKVNKYSNLHQSCALPSAHFMAMVYDVVSAGMNFHSMFGDNK